MKHKELNLLMAIVEEQIRHKLLNEGQSLSPTWVLIDAAGNSTLFSTPWNNELEKRLAEIFLRLRIRRFGAVAYLFMSECWVAIATAPEREKGFPATLPRERSDKFEAVIALACVKGRALWKVWKMLRDSEQRVTVLEPHFGENAHQRSWISTLLE